VCTEHGECEATSQVVQRPHETGFIAQEPEQIQSETLFGFWIGFQSL
jgi:hypothetical protein